MFSFKEDIQLKGRNGNIHQEQDGYIPKSYILKKLHMYL